MQFITMMLIVGVTLTIFGMFMNNSHPNHPK